MPLVALECHRRRRRPRPRPTATAASPRPPRRSLLANLRPTGRPPPPELEGRPRLGGRRPRGPRLPRRRPARAVRGDVRRALVRRRARAGRHDPRSASPIRPAASSTRATTTRRSSTRPKDLQDNAVPSGNAMAATVLLELAALTGDGALPRPPPSARSGWWPAVVGRYPSGFAQWLVALDFALADVVEVAVVGAPDDPATRAPAGTGPDRLPAAPRRRLRRGPGGERRSRCSDRASSSTVGRRRSSAATSPAASRSTSPRRWPPSL